MHHDTHRRSIAKALSWKLLAAILAYAIAYVVTGEVKDSLGIALGMFFVGIVAYYFHERLWDLISWGRIK